MFIFKIEKKKFHNKLENFSLVIILISELYELKIKYSKTGFLNTSSLESHFALEPIFARNVFLFKKCFIYRRMTPDGNTLEPIQ
jgi:hypothetical protein